MDKQPKLAGSELKTLILEHASQLEEGISIYLHVPFCASRCGYCDFNTYALGAAGATPSQYLIGAHREIELAAKLLNSSSGQKTKVNTVFFGGGTPTLLPVADLTGLLAKISEVFSLTPGSEITIEANPETLNAEVLTGLLDGGFNRISLGIQSVKKSVLKVLDRAHTPGNGLKMAKLAKEVGFSQLNLDFIFGAPGESLADWQETLEAGLEIAPQHFSCYSLIVEPGTALARRIASGEIEYLAEDDLADDLAQKYYLAYDRLAQAGYQNYEVSNWAAPGGRCEHNMAYWLSKPWWGIGPGAHSHLNGLRWWNQKRPKTYLDSLSIDQLPAAGFEQLSRTQIHQEKVMLQLRLADGIDLAELSDTEKAKIQSGELSRLVVFDNGRVRLNREGILLADYVIRTVLD